jgi:hypothetical protein
MRVDDARIPFLDETESGEPTLLGRQPSLSSS